MARRFFLLLVVAALALSLMAERLGEARDGAWPLHAADAEEEVQRA